MEVGPAGAHGVIKEAIIKGKEHAPIQNQPMGELNVEVILLLNLRAIGKLFYILTYIEKIVHSSIFS